MTGRITAQHRLTWHTAALLGILLAALVLLTWDINAPFVRQGSYDEIIYTLHASAYDRYGLVETRLALVYPAGDPAAPLTDTDHHASRSVLLTILLTVIYKSLGYHEWAGRLIGIASTLVSLLALHSIAKRLWTKRIALIATLVMALTPSMVIFGRETWTVPPQIACWLVAIYLYVRWFQTERPFNLWGMAVCLTLGILFSPWSGLFLPPFIALHGLIFDHKHRWRILVWSGGAGLVAMLLFAAHLTWLGPVAWQDLFERVALRAGVSGVDTSPSIAVWLAKMGWRISGWNTPVATLLGILVLAAATRRIIKQRKATLSDQILIILAAAGLTILLVFPQLAWVHHYVSVFVVPYLSVASALAIDALLTQTPHHKLALIGVIVLTLGWLGSSVAMINIQSQYRLREFDVFAQLDQSLQPGDRVLVAGEVPFTFQFYFRHPWTRVEIDDYEWDMEARSNQHNLGLIFFQPDSPVETQAASLASQFPSGRVDTDPPLSPSFLIVQLNERTKEVPALVTKLNNIPERNPPNRLETLIQETRKQVEIQLGIRTRLD